MLIYFYIEQEYGNSVEALREFSFVTVCLRLVLATLCGGLIGYGRTKKNRAAGLRTYMLTSAGAALAVLISLYEFSMLEGPWASVVAEVGQRYDVSRVAAQVSRGAGHQRHQLFSRWFHHQRRPPAGLRLDDCNRSVRVGLHGHRRRSGIL